MVAVNGAIVPWPATQQRKNEVFSGRNRRLGNTFNGGIPPLAISISLKLEYVTDYIKNVPRSDA